MVRVISNFPIQIKFRARELEKMQPLEKVDEKLFLLLYMYRGVGVCGVSIV